MFFCSLSQRGCDTAMSASRDIFFGDGQASHIGRRQLQLLLRHVGSRPCASSFGQIEDLTIGCNTVI
jgi:hypothetical protein